jgi:hypothetical protein
MWFPPNNPVTAFSPLEKEEKVIVFRLFQIYFGLGLKRGSDEESIGDEAKDNKMNRAANQDGMNLPKLNIIYWAKLSSNGPMRSKTRN